MTLKSLSPEKVRCVTEIADRLVDVPEVKSVTFAGSFVDATDLSGISDIDTIVIVEELSPEVLRTCQNALADLDCATLRLPGNEVYLNVTFGPLKFDTPGRVVIHLMIYSVSGHRDHVLSSPFTCFDWERSRVYFGSSLRSLYPVLALQPRHFLGARRGLRDYLRDLEAGSIQFRRYEIVDDKVREVLDHQFLDHRHRGEFAYHIVRNFLGNYAKLLARSNVRLTTDELLAFWTRALPRSAQFCKWFTELERCKRERQTIFPEDTLNRTLDFVRIVFDEIEEVWQKRGIRHAFVRHARTSLNDGTFLGQGRDPGILEKPSTLAVSYHEVVCSPARRCRETAAALAPGLSVRIDDRLHEINYGNAEGLSYADLHSAHPELVNAWSRGEDPCFPQGENSAMVATRLRGALADLAPHSTLVVTHNFVLRCLIGSGLGIPSTQWHLIPVSHGEVIEVVQLGAETFLDLTTDQIASIADALVAAERKAPMNS